MSPNGRLWVVAIGALVVGGLIGAGALYANQQSSDASLNAQIIKAEADRDASALKAEELATALQDAKSTASAAATEAAPSTPSTPEPTPAKKPAAKATKHFTYITKIVGTASKPVIVADYAQMLSGDAAAAAATAHGEESPPPNDYFIVNDNKVLRRLTVKSGIGVTVTTNTDGTNDPDGHSVTFEEWVESFNAQTAENESLRDSPYWITVKNGIVTKIAQQYLP